MRGCAHPELAAVNKAISRGGYALVATGLQMCLEDGGPDNVDAKKQREDLPLAGLSLPIDEITGENLF